MKLVASGKVRELYEISDGKSLLLLASDRISAFDCVMKTEIYKKGIILTQLSLFWFEMLGVNNHLLPSANTTTTQDLITTGQNDITKKYGQEVASRSMIVKKLKILPVEAIVRGYLTGSAYTEYSKSQTIHSIKMPAGLILNQRLPKPLFTPSTKATQGHDENIHPDVLKTMIGEEMARKVEELAIKIYEKAFKYAWEKGIIIADTKFEFGVDGDDLVLADEVLTPDSSRFWDRDAYQIGVPQDSFDKQYLRDYLTSINFDKKEGVELPEDVVLKTREKYGQVYERLVGKKFDWE